MPEQATICESPERRVGQRYRLVKVMTLRVADSAKQGPRDARHARSPEEAIMILRAWYDATADDTERVVILTVDVKNRILGLHPLFAGAVDQSAVYVSTVLRHALVGTALAPAGAAGFILCHNHPSGEPSPSDEDCKLTANLLAAARAVGLRLLDHIILGDGTGESYSFRSAGKLEA